MTKYLRDIVANIHKDAEWDSNKTSGFVEHPAPIISRIIADKTILVKTYRKTDEMWLVIERSSRPSETVLPIHGVHELNTEYSLRNNLDNSSFSRVYVFTAMGLFQWDRLGGWQNV